MGKECESLSPAKFAPARAARALVPGPRPRTMTLACSRDLAQGTPRCERETQVCGTQVCWGSRVAGETQLNGPKRSQTLPKVMTLQKGLGVPSFGEGVGGARPARSSLFREYPAGRPGSGGGEAPAGKQVPPARP